MITKVLKGHNSRGEEVIELLKMLGGQNTVGFKTTFTGFYYWINENNEIVASDMPPQNSMVYPLEDFEDEYPYKVGDCVRYYPHKVSVIKSMFISYDGDVKYELEGVDDRFFQTHQLEYVGRAEYSERKENNKNMTQLAIKGHETRGEEVIQLLEMLGGVNYFNLDSTADRYCYYIDNNDNKIHLNCLPANIENVIVFTLEEFEEKFPYKVGDKVLYIPENKTYFIRKMFWKNDKVVYELSDEIYTEGCSMPDTIIFDVDVVKLQPYKEENYCQVIGNNTSNEGIDLQKLEKQLDEALEKETKESLEEIFFGDPEPQPKAPILSNRYDYAAGKCGYVIPDGYEFDYIKNGFQKEIILKPIVEHKSHQTDIDAEQENTKTSFTFDCIRNEKGENQLIIPSHLEVIIEDGIYILREKKPQYPKTYSECCKIVNASIFVSLVYNLTDGEGYSHDVDNLKIYDNIRRLKICRDAYWKIAGEELGLDKPWEPDWNNDEEYKYGLFRLRDDIYKDASCINPTLLIFPTKEMRDAFYENFKDLIEGCKEFL